MHASPALAHGVSGRTDLPVPTSYFVVGAGLALVISFAALAILWKSPRLQEATAGRALGTPVILRALPVLGLAGLGFVIIAGVAGEPSLNLLPAYVVWIYFWLVVPFLGAALGNWWRHLNPWRALARWVNHRIPERDELSTGLGVWPAAAAFMAFTWFELVPRNTTEAPAIAIAAIVYTVYLLAATRLMGVETGLQAADAFTVYNGLIAGHSTLDLDNSPARTRGWLRGLATAPAPPGLVFFVAAMIGTVTYDGLSESQWWIRTFSSVEQETWFATLALFVIVGLVAAGYLAASAVAASIARQPLRRVARRFAHTLVPIALAYAVAHYFTLVLFTGQRLVFAISDPFALGWDLFGTASGSESVDWLSSNAVWYIQVIVIITGHIAGVVLAHDRALADFPEKVAVRTQYAMLGLMVVLTGLGLLILSG
jgi:hypothetical protein